MELLAIVGGAIFTAGATVAAVKGSLKGLSKKQDETTTALTRIENKVVALDKALAVHVQASDDHLRRLEVVEDVVKDHDQRIRTIEQRSRAAGK